MTQPTAEQLALARECAVTAAHSARFDDEILSFWTSAWSDMAKGIFEEGATQSALLAIQATEARMAAAVEADVEKIARIIDPSSWAVMDGYLSDMLRKYKGQNIGYDPDAFKHKQSMATARALLPIIRAHLEPTNEMAQAVMDCGPIGCCNISSTEARDIILSALKASPIGDVG